MAQFVAMSPDVEVNGQTVRSMVSAVGSLRPRMMEILEAHGVADPDPEAWYAQQRWLDALRHIAVEIGPNTLYKIGTTIPRSASFPPHIAEVGSALKAIDVAYHMNHRGGEIGHYAFQSAGASAARIVCDNPYPCEFDRGIIQAMVRRFAGASSIGVRHDEARPCRCRDGDSCTYVVTW